MPTSMQQGNREFSTYLAEFQRHAAEVNWDEPSRLAVLKRAWIEPQAQKRPGFYLRGTNETHRLYHSLQQARHFKELQNYANFDIRNVGESPLSSSKLFNPHFHLSLHVRNAVHHTSPTQSTSLPHHTNRLCQVRLL
jgi:hypothetical protein